MKNVHIIKVICQSDMLFWARTNLVQKKSGFEVQKYCGELRKMTYS